MSDQQVGARKHRRAAHVATAIHEHWNRVEGVDNRAHRRAAAQVLEGSDLHAERQPVGPVEFRDDRTVGGETPLRVVVAVRIPLEFVEVPRATG